MSVERSRASVEAITSGAVIFGAAVGYVTVRNQLALLGQVAAVSVIAFFIFVWLGVFATPVMRSLWTVARQRTQTDAKLTARIEAMERKHNELTASWSQETQVALTLISLLELNTSVQTLFLMSDRLTTQQMSLKLTSLTNYASQIVRNMNSLPNPAAFQDALKSTLGVLILIAALKRIPFETLASTLANGLGLHYAERVVDVSSIVEGYGMDYATKWRDLVRRS